MPASTSAPADPTSAPLNRAAAWAGPRAAVLDQDGITAAALQLIGKSGYDGFTMAALARTLNVAPSALYNHVSSKAGRSGPRPRPLDLVRGCHGLRRRPLGASRAGLGLELPRRVLQTHPLIPVIAVLPVADAPKTLAMYEAVSAGFSRAGFPQERIIPAIVAFESFIFGSAYDATAPADIFDSGSMAEATPNFTSAVRRQAEDSQEKPADAAFRLGLEALLAGLGALRTG